MIGFIWPLYNWLQQFTNHYLTHCHLLPTGHSMETILTSNWTELSIQSQSHIATEGQSVNKFWCRASSGAHDQIFITVWQLRSSFVGLPLWREDGSVFCTCCFVGFLLYSLGSDHSREKIRCLAMDLCEPHRKHLLRHWFYCCVRVHVFRALPRNESSLLLVAYLLRACLPRRSLAMNLYVTLKIYLIVHIFVRFTNNASREWDTEKHYDVIKSFLNMCDAKIANFHVAVRFIISRSRTRKENVTHLLRNLLCNRRIGTRSLWKYE
jgi:hypothetical protein